ncbi:uncharacterized protein LOC134542274 [Bacillus rossius redtenbacheri]|uniref:uncharacterized protein LOC134542274 n=1 Tax=Bacillus rossius redtenbacheri TaxID=93214 RepID=UPI002FDE5519
MGTPALVLLSLLLWRPAQSLGPPAVNRHRDGDTYTPMGTPCARGPCSELAPGPCQCRCPPEAPVFRDDQRLCVADVQECPVAPFTGGSGEQKIPFVFLPLKGQIINPSSEISFAGMTTPICAVSSAQFLTKDGWADLQNSTYSEPPFRLFRDEGRTFLMWLGEEELWARMEGRLVLVRLMCRDGGPTRGQSLFAPCVAFRVAGTPSERPTPAPFTIPTFPPRIRGVVFESPAQAQSPGLSASEYVAIAACSVLLGLVYAAAVLLFLHVRRRRKARRARGAAAVPEDGEREPVVKSNPLLGLRRQLQQLGAGDHASCAQSDSASCCSDPDDFSDDVVTSEDGGRTTHKVTSAMVHTCSAPDLGPPLAQESSSIERLPEENVSIVETESRDEQPDTVKAISCGTARRKLYFNPAYFEPEMLADPPAAAIEFLTKIREVISIAKHKMSAKRFLPSLIRIPEEEIPPPFTSL